jgi:hypothetical protein
LPPAKNFISYSCWSDRKQGPYIYNCKYLNIEELVIRYAKVYSGELSNKKIVLKRVEQNVEQKRKYLNKEKHCHKIHKSASCVELHGDFASCVELHGDSASCVELHGDYGSCVELHGDSGSCVGLYGDSAS